MGRPQAGESSENNLVLKTNSRSRRQEMVTRNCQTNSRKKTLIFFSPFFPEIDIFCLRKNFGPGKSV